MTTVIRAVMDLLRPGLLGSLQGLLTANKPWFDSLPSVPLFRQTDRIGSLFPQQFSRDSIICARAAYLDDFFTKPDCLRKIGGENTRFCTIAESQYFVAEFGDFVVLSWRGTEPFNMADWLLDANVRLCRLPHPMPRDAHVHRGFLTGMSLGVLGGLEKHLRDSVARIGKAKAKIILTGHSLGAAEAALTALLLCVVPQHLPVAGVFLFGCPRIGDAAFVDSYNRMKTVDGPSLGDLTYRFWNRGDPAPRLPFPTLLLPLTWNYALKSVGRPIPLTSGASASTVEEVSDSGLIDPFDHESRAYQENLSK